MPSSPPKLSLKPLYVDVNSSASVSSNVSSTGTMSKYQRSQGVPKFNDKKGSTNLEYVNKEYWPKVVKVMNSRLTERDTKKTSPNPFSTKSSKPFRSKFAPPKDTSTSKTRKRYPAGKDHILEEQREKIKDEDERKTRGKKGKKTRW
jgi:hypothetical protein